MEHPAPDHCTGALFPVPRVEIATSEAITLEQLSRHQVRYFKEASGAATPQIPQQQGLGEFPYDLSLAPYAWPLESPWWRRMACAIVGQDQ